MDLKQEELEFDKIVRNAVEMLRQTTAEIDAMTAQLKELNRRARFIAQCMGLDL